MVYTKENYAYAYKEVMEILACLSVENLNKIPQDVIEHYYNDMDNDYEYTVDINNFENQTMAELTEILLANLFRDYLATPFQKERIRTKEKQDTLKMDEELQSKYNPNDVFKHIHSEDKDRGDIDENFALVEIKEKELFEKVIDRIIKFFKKK